MSRSHPPDPTARRNFDWTCDVCGKKRPDNRIGVKRHLVTNSRDVTYSQHVKFCNDNEDCEKKATICNLTELALARVSLERDKWKSLALTWRHRARVLVVAAGCGLLAAFLERLL